MNQVNYFDIDVCRVVRILLGYIEGIFENESIDSDVSKHFRQERFPKAALNVYVDIDLLFLQIALIFFTLILGHANIGVDILMFSHTFLHIRMLVRYIGQNVIVLFFS